MPITCSTSSTTGKTIPRNLRPSSQQVARFGNAHDAWRPRTRAPRVGRLIHQGRLRDRKNRSLKSRRKLDRGAYARLKVTRLAASVQGVTVPLCRSVVCLPNQRIYEVIARRNLTTVGDLWKSSEHRDGHKLSSPLCRSYRVLENTPFRLQLICKIQRSGGVSPL